VMLPRFASLLPAALLLVGVWSCGEDSAPVEPTVRSCTASGGAELMANVLGDPGCVGRRVPVAADGRVHCSLFEVRDAPSCDCTGARRAIPRRTCDSLRARLEGTAFERDACICELLPIEDAALGACLHDPAAAGPAGWCYVATECAPDGLSPTCGDAAPGWFRFLGVAVPVAGSALLVACGGAEPDTPEGGECPGR
jgi:hypothetical protein